MAQEGVSREECVALQTKSPRKVHLLLGRREPAFQRLLGLYNSRYSSLAGRKRPRVEIAEEEHAEIEG